MAGFQLTPVEGDPFQERLALQDYARTLPAPPPAPLDDFGYRPPGRPQPALPGLAGVAGDPSRSLAVRIPAAIGSSLADQGVGLARSAWGAAMLPGDVARRLVDPSSPEAIRRSTDLAGLLTLPAAGGEFNPDIARMGLTPVEGDPFERTVRLYHGTTDEGMVGIQETGKIYGKAFFSPRRSAAEDYAGDARNVVSAEVPISKLKIDADLPGAKLLPVDEANSYLGNNDWTIHDYLDAGHSVGTEEDVPIR